jgi:hypothetical protein
VQSANPVTHATDGKVNFKENRLLRREELRIVRLHLPIDLIRCGLDKDILRNLV